MSHPIAMLFSSIDNIRQEIALIIASEHAPTGLSPYTPHSVDAAIAHLERILGQAQAASIFGAAYLRDRVMQVRATKGLAPVQMERVARLINKLNRVHAQ
ncbi:hypothetical protein [Caballeronia sp. SBC2]|uniref:hypothetical protein n=1 Tax=Caballeronia sp. SBC2 TaxID=2705547 RepID=UPI0013E10039|nr:hypothetical protein [Caballeronia sp. SBC2]QIE30343.1 hypothetical protein SBC2_84200 [Caballeronia sp. SBC2]